MLRKYVFYILFLVSFIFQSCKTKNDKTVGYTIIGSIDGIQNGKAFLAKLDLVTNERIDVDSAFIKNGKFTFKGKVESPYLHTIFINDKSNSIQLFLENSDLEINGDIEDLEHTRIIGSKEDSLFHSYKTDDIFDRKKGKEIMLDFPDYSFAAFTAYYQFQIYNIQVDTMDLIMNNFSDPVKKTVYYQHLEELYQTLRRVSISQPAPKFIVPDTEGKLVRLEDFEGKYVLIDFWASWCAPCRAENPRLVDIYNTFKDKDFIVVGISVDKNRNSWLKAIRTDSLPWINLSNLKGWDEVSDRYGVKAIPQDFLLGPNGTIIGKNFDPDDLTKRLNEILQPK